MGWATVALCALPQAASDLIRGEAAYPKRNENTVATIQDCRDFINTTNFLTPSVRTLLRQLGDVSFKNQTLHAVQMLVHLKILEDNEESVYMETATHKKYLITVVEDEQVHGDETTKSNIII